jgi:hypothetical protein
MFVEKWRTTTMELNLDVKRDLVCSKADLKSKQITIKQYQTYKEKQEWKNYYNMDIYQLQIHKAIK